MLTKFISRIVDLCLRFPRSVVIAGLLLALAGSVYTATHFAITSDIDSLLSKDLPWRQRGIAFENAFRRFEIVNVVVDAPTPELAAAATEALTGAFKQDTTHFKSVTNSSAADFFSRNGLLFLPEDQLKQSLDGLKQGEALISDLGQDPSLRGLVSAAEDTLIGVNQHKLELDATAPVFGKVAQTMQEVLAGKPASFSWRALMTGHPPSSLELRGFIEVRPVLDFKSVEPGHAATQALRAIAAKVAPAYQARVRLTGPVAMADEEFATIKENAALNGSITFAIVLLILWLALRSFKLMFAVFVNLLVGLPITAAVGLLLVGTFNLISVYFAVLFVGIGIDFSIQYSVRYRAERHEIPDLREAIRAAGHYVAAPLTLAGVATALGFFSFLPTHYKGVSELGVIAGCGMLIAYASSVTVLPALISLLNPKGEPEPLGYTALAPLDAFLDRNRMAVLYGVIGTVVVLLPALFWLRFDFNPINLRNPHTESIATYLDLKRDPATNLNALEVLAPNLDAANAIAAKVAKLPEVSRATTLSFFIPPDQDKRLPEIAQAAKALAGAFDPAHALAPPTDKENVEALSELASRLEDSAKENPGPGAQAAKSLAAALASLAKADVKVRESADEVFVAPLKRDLAALKAALSGEKVTRDNLPKDLVADWVAADGRARVSIAPSADPNDNDAMRKFAKAVLAVEPDVTQGPVTILEASDTVLNAFIEAGVLALASIALLLWLVLGRLSDMLMTLIPLSMAAVVTMEICALIGWPLNFANIIAFPLLLGVGVAFKIYYIMAWRDGVTNLLQTSLTRAVIYSAMTTAVAFGSLMFSSHPGTASMGRLLALSLITTLCAAVLFQPILMGKPRQAEPGSH
ncbi:MAG: MMPL family transporter [Pseudomonadota bacterium]|nr:MMPL family transporter [Pseudomonadota bacterium]